MPDASLEPVVGFRCPSPNKVLQRRKHKAVQYSTHTTAGSSRVLVLWYKPRVCRWAAERHSQSENSCRLDYHNLASKVIFRSITRRSVDGRFELGCKSVGTLSDLPCVAALLLFTASLGTAD